MDPQRGEERQTDLDGLRGLAALAVFAHHALLLIPALSDAALSGERVISAPGWRWLVKSPLHLFWGGYEAVIVFFVLSGFVLFTALERTVGGYLPFIVKRFVRLYPPYVVAVLTAFALQQWVYAGDLPGASHWLKEVWRGGDSVTMVRHLSLVGTFDVSAINPVVWSLVHEARISLVFPGVAFVVRRISFGAAVTLGLTLVLVGYLAGKLLGGDICMTVQYLGPFVVGAALARKRADVKRLIVGLGSMRRGLLLVLSGLCLTYYWWFPLRSGIAINVGMRDVAAIIGASGMVAVAFSGTASGFFSLRPIHWIGRISYSFYLVHAVIILAVVHSSFNQLSWWLYVAAAFGLSLAVGELMNIFVEIPSMRFGRVLAKRLSQGKRPTPAEAQGG